MSNYAWANPTTGIREQASTKEEARLLAWEELQTEDDRHTTVTIFEQERIGSVTSTTATLDAGDRWEAGYAWANPSSGRRDSAGAWEYAVEDIQFAFAEMGGSVPVDSVTVYRQRHACFVNWDDPKPEIPVPTIPDPDTPQSLIEQVLQGTCGDLGRAQLLAMLWIAESGMEIAGALHYAELGHPSQWPENRPRRNPGRRRLYRRYPNLWGYIKQAFRRWWRGKVEPIEENDNPGICEVCGGPSIDQGTPICPRCATEALRQNEILRSGGTPTEEKEEVPETPAQAEERRARAFRERDAQRNVPSGLIFQRHVFLYPATGDISKCQTCGLPFEHVIHTGKVKPW